MLYPITHQVQFDRQGRSYSAQRLTIPASDLKPDFYLSNELAEQLNTDYFTTIDRVTHHLYRPFVSEDKVRIHMPVFGDTLVLECKQVIVTDQMAEVNWRVTGGFMLARPINNDGKLVIGAEWIDRDKQELALYTRVENYTTRLINFFGVRLGIFVYHLTQGVSHKHITHEYLRFETTRWIKPRSI